LLAAICKGADKYGRSCRTRVFLGYDRSAQGDYVVPQEPGRKHLGTGRLLGLQAGRLPATCAAGLPCARPVRGDRLCADERLQYALVAQLRRSHCARSSAPQHGHDGCTDLLHPPARRPALYCTALCRYAPVCFRFSTAAGRNIRRVRAAQRTHHTGTLRYDGDRYEHVQSVTWRAASWHRRPASAGCGRAGMWC
jgi:hypothetical protein